MSLAYGPRTLRVASVLEGSHDVVQPLSARKRHVSMMQPLQDGGGDLTHNHTHGSDPYPEHHRDRPIISGPCEPQQGDCQPATGLDWHPVVRPASFNGWSNLFEHVVEGVCGDPKLRFPLILVEEFD